MSEICDKVKEKYRPMPRSKRKELEEKLGESCKSEEDNPHEPAGDESSDSEDPEPLPTHLPEEVDVKEEDSECEGSQEEEDDPGGDALDGVDLFQGVKLEEQEQFEEEKVVDYEELPDKMETEDEFFEEEESNQQWQKGPCDEEEDPMKDEPSEPAQNNCVVVEREALHSSDDGSESSADAADLAFNFTKEELIEIRRKRRRERREFSRRRHEEEKKRKEMLDKAKKDRFFDKSRQIPSEIYFGDIKVPLHVLHAYGTGNSEDPRMKYPHLRSNYLSLKPTLSKAKERYTPATAPKPPTCDRVEVLKKCLRAAGVKPSLYNPILRTNLKAYQICNELMGILRKHGLKGDPTVAKCKSLKISNGADMYLLPDDVDLDPSAIINPNGRTLRSGTTTIVTEEEEKKQKEIMISQVKDD